MNDGQPPFGGGHGHTFSFRPTDTGRSIMNGFLAATAVATLTIGGLAACATKRYVQTTVGDVSQQVTSLSSAVEETQEQARKNDARIKEVDTAVQSVQQTAQQASQVAKEATTLARTVETKIDAIETANKRLVYEVILSEDDVMFGFEDTDLSETAKTELTALVETLKRDPRNVFIAIEDHTDSTGPQTVNDRIGLERAEAVERYLYEEHDIPLLKMDVISYGEDKPAASNTTRAGRAQNRRVVIKVMA